MPLAHRQRLETETPIERIRLRIQRLRQQRADAGMMGELKQTSPKFHRILGMTSTFVGLIVP